MVRIPSFHERDTNCQMWQHLIYLDTHNNQNKDVLAHNMPVDYSFSFRESV